MSASLGDLTEAVKSANAGASWITFDIVFADDATYHRVCRCGAVERGVIARLYRVDPAGVAIYQCDAVRTIKVTIPRRVASGGPDETDFDGTQQFAPLLDIEVPPAPRDG